jgi:hypothetical protein
VFRGANHIARHSIPRVLLPLRPAFRLRDESTESNIRRVAPVSRFSPAQCFIPRTNLYIAVVSCASLYSGGPTVRDRWDRAPCFRIRHPRRPGRSLNCSHRDRPKTGYAYVRPEAHCPSSQERIVILMPLTLLIQARRALTERYLYLDLRLTSRCPRSPTDLGRAELRLPVD